ncbi:MAG: hypothetical protein VW683_03350 [Betaproteobacteria bacterium]
MNIIEQTEALKDLPDQRLMQEMQAPTGFAPQFLVLSELKRRKRMRDEYQRQQAANMKTVAEEAVTAAGVPQEGIMQMSQAMNPNSSIAQNTGADQRPQMQPTQAPQMMADGGVVRMFDGGMSGGTMSAIAYLKANYPDEYRKAVQEGTVEQVAEYMQARAADAPYALDALEDPAPFFMKRPSQRSVDKKQLEIEESQPERALQARIDSRTALSRYGDDDPIFGPSTLEQLERPVTGKYTAALDIPVTSVEGKLPLPPSDPLGPVPDMTEQGVKTPSGSVLSGLIPPVADDGFGTESIQNMQEQERQDDIYKFLANPNSAAIADRLDEANLEGDENYRKRILEGNLAAHKGLFFPKGSSGQEVARKDVNLRALQFLQGDQFTPPSEIYSDLLGGDLYTNAKYQEEPSTVIDQMSDDIYYANRADQEANALKSLNQQDMNAQRKSDEFFRMLEINNPPVAYDRSPTTEFINNLLAGGTDDKGDDKGEAITEDLPEGFQLRMGAAPEGALSFGKLTDDTSTNPAGNKVTGGQKASATSSLGGIEGRIAKMLEEKEKSAQSDKWMALAQAGMALMASDAPTLGGAIGEAGLVGLGALKKGKDQYDKDVLDLLTLQQRIDAQKARSSGRGGLTASNMISLMDDLRRYKGDIQDRIDALNSPTNLMDPAEKERQIKGLQQELFRTDIELGTYRNALRGTGSIGSQPFDVRGGSAQQPSVGYSLGTASQ